MDKYEISGFKLFQLAPGIQVAYHVEIEGYTLELCVYTHWQGRKFRIDPSVPWMDLPVEPYIAAVVLDTPRGTRWKIGELSLVGTIITFFTHPPHLFVPPQQQPPTGPVNAA